MRSRAEASKAFPASALVLTLLVSAMAGTQFVNWAGANPNPFYPQYVFEGEVSPDYFTKPPTVSIFSPRNNSAYAVNNVSLALNVSVGNSTTASSRFILEITYKVDWLPNNVTAYEFIPAPQPTSVEEWRAYKPTPTITEFSTSLNLTGIPEGTHRVVVYAREKGSYERQGGLIWGTMNYNVYTSNFNINGSSAVFFTVDTISPAISVLSIENKTYYTPNISLNFTVSESVSKIAYSLDGQDNVTISGNTTLTELPNAAHNVTFYAWDNVGNIGSSKTIYFTVEPSSTALATTAIAAIGIGVVSAAVFFAMRRRANHTQK